jgi:hypothetical protein
MIESLTSEDIENLVAFKSNPNGTFVRYKVERAKHLFKGDLSNVNMMELRKDILCAEADAKSGVDKESPELKNETKRMITQISNCLIKNGIRFIITGHGGISNWIRLVINGLNQYSDEIASEYRLRFARDLLKTIGFKSDLCQLDESLVKSI